MVCFLLKIVILRKSGFCLSEIHELQTFASQVEALQSFGFKLTHCYSNNVKFKDLKLIMNYKFLLCDSRAEMCLSLKHVHLLFYFLVDSFKTETNF